MRRVRHVQIWPSERTGPSQCCSCAGTFRGLSRGSANTSGGGCGQARAGGGPETISCGTTCGDLTRRWPLITSSRSKSLEPSRRSWNRSRMMHGGLLCGQGHSAASATTFKQRFGCLNRWTDIKLFTDITMGCELQQAPSSTELAFYRGAFLSIETIEWIHDSD